MRTWPRLRIGSAAVVALLLALAVLAGRASAASHDDDARRAAAALAHKVSDLVALGAFAGDLQAQPLTQALQGLPLDTPTAHDALVARLQSDDQTATAALTQLAAAAGPGARISLETRTALTALTPAQLAAVSGGKALTSPRAGLYLEALADLAERDGEPPSTPGTPPNPADVNAALAGDLSATSGGHSRSSHPWVWIVVGVVAAVAVAAPGLRRVSRRPAPAHVTTPDSSRLVPGQPAPAAVHTVLDASRRLTTLPVGEDMPRALVREALTLVPGWAAALVERRGDELVVAHESQPGLLRPDGLAGGIVERALSSSRPLTQLVTGDPSFTRHPLQALLLPLANAGRIDAVVVIVRDASSTFTAAEVELLATFGSVAAAARESASRTRAAVDASLVDPLTGAGNRRQLDAQLAAVLQAAAGAPTALCMVDLDHFKSVNDTYGHPAGDALLRNVCTTIRNTVRPTDGVYRYGGEEFCILLPGTTLTEAQETAERVRAAVASSSYDVGGGQTLTATASLGVAVATGEDVGTLVQRADRALYDAKHGGRNRVSVG